MKTVRMHNPPHPGEVLRALCLVLLNLSVTAPQRHWVLAAALCLPF